MSFKIIKKSSILSMDEVIAEPKSEYPHRIGDFVPTPTFSLLADPENIFYSINFPSSDNHHQLYKLHEFKAELWKQDVFEVFFGNLETQHYQEFNFSPRGAYWKASFQNYREKIQDSDLPNSEIKIDLRAILSGWTLTARLPISIITVVDINSASLLVNCAAIMGKNNRSFFATAPIDLLKPDFHLKQTWPSPEVVFREGILQNPTGPISEVG